MKLWGFLLVIIYDIRKVLILSIFLFLVSYFLLTWNFPKCVISLSPNNQRESSTKGSAYPSHFTSFRSPFIPLVFSNYFRNSLLLSFPIISIHFGCSFWFILYSQGIPLAFSFVVFGKLLMPWSASPLLVYMLAYFYSVSLDTLLDTSLKKTFCPKNDNQWIPESNVKS